MSNSIKKNFNNELKTSNVEYVKEENIFIRFINYIKSLFNFSNSSNNVVNNSIMTDNIKNDYSNEFIGMVSLLLVIIVCIFIGYGLYILISRNLHERSGMIIEETKKPVLCNKLSIYPINNLNTTKNGQRRTYIFWMYINDLNKNSGLYKRVLHIGDDSNIYNASPYVFLDKTENKLYVRFSKKDDKDNNIENVKSLHELVNMDEFMSTGIEIPYIPIQRWVHVAIVVNETSNNGSITVYIDGDLSNTVSSNDYSPYGTLYKINDLNLDKIGSLYVGGSSDGSEGVGFSGLISKFSMFNYDLNIKDIYDNYNEGPVSGFLHNVGLGSYGIRNPIYKIS